jgi:DNA-binding response OmpR family regulator
MPSSSPTPAPTVLVIDDSRELLDLLDQLLTAEGYRVVTAPSLECAQEQLATRRPDLVISDVRLPGAPLFAVRELLAADATTRDLPLLLCTGAVQEVKAAAPQLAQAGVAVVTKPFDIEDLLAAVRRLCRPAVSPNGCESPAITTRRGCSP